MPDHLVRPAGIFSLPTFGDKRPLRWLEFSAAGLNRTIHCKRDCGLSEGGYTPRILIAGNPKKQQGTETGAR